MSGSSPHMRPDSTPRDPYLAQIDVVEYLRLLWRSRWTILAVMIVFGAAAAVASFTWPRMHEATAGLQVQKGPGVKDANTDLIEIQQACLNAGVVQQAVHDAGLDRPPLNMGPDAFVAKALSVPPIDGDVVRVQVRLADPRLASAAAGAVLRHAVDLAREQDRQREKTVAGSLAAMQARVRDAAQGVDRARAALRRFQSQTRIDRLQAESSAATKLSGTMPELLADIAAARGQLKAAEQLLAQTPRTIAMPGDGTRQVVNPLYTELGRDVASARTGLAALEARRDFLRTSSALDRFTVPAKDQDDQARLEEALTMATMQQARLGSDYQDALLQADAPKPTLHVLDETVTPVDSIGLHPARNIAAGIALAFFLCAMAVLALHAFRPMRS